MMSSTDSSCDSNPGTCSHCFKHYIVERLWVRGLAYLLLYFLLFMPCMALLFMAIEGPVEAQEKTALRLARQAFLANNSCLTDAQLEQFLATVLAANNRGVSALRNASIGPSSWSFGQALFFASTVVTTIGYGRTRPLSYLGKAMCIVIALIGIPLTLVAFSVAAGWLRLLSLRFLAWLRLWFPPDGQSRAALLHLSIIFACLFVCFLLVPAAAFASLERDWTYLDAFYYCVISLTTVGLGDFIVGEDPDQENRLLYKISAVVYLYAGLIFLVFALRSFADLPALNPGRFIYANDLDQLLDRDQDDVAASGGSGGGGGGLGSEEAKLLRAPPFTSKGGSSGESRRGYDSTNSSASPAGGVNGVK